MYTPAAIHARKSLKQNVGTTIMIWKQIKIKLVATSDLGCYILETDKDIASSYIFICAVMLWKTIKV